MKEITRPHADIHIRHLTGRDPDTGLFPPALLAQFRQALAQGASELQRDGYTLQDVTHIVFTLTGTKDFTSSFSLLNELFGHSCPATTFRLVRTYDKPGQLIELDLMVRQARS